MVNSIFVWVAVFVGLVAIVSPIVFIQVRKVFREQKNFERGLKMVPLLIHLPPISDDTDVGGRDVRDIEDENISKAQILYNIIASTYKKGFKNKFYGQRQIAFEIVASKGAVHFYAAVPVALVDIVKQAVVSAYPSASLEEVPEHNIFSPVGKISGTVGVELGLKENYAYPLATYQDLKRDAMQSLLNSLSTLDKEDGAGIQILLRPASSDWRKNALAVAANKRKGKDSSKGGAKAAWWLKNLLVATVKPPEHKGVSGEKTDLSHIDQNTVDAIEEKTRYPGYEVLIRVLASSSSPHKAESIRSNIVATFSLFDAPGKNGFRYTPAKDIDRFVTAYVLRLFPQENNKNVLNSIELATLFHFPDQRNIPTSQLERQASKQVDGPRNVSEDGILLGYNIFRGVKKAIRLSIEDRRRHMYVVGQTGVGKSIFLENLALQDMLAGRGFAFVDPHGETVERILAMVPKERTEDVVYFCPADMDYPMGLNIFEFHTPEQKDFLIQEAINMLEKLYDPHNQGIIGPRYHHLFRNAALTVMSNPEGGTFVDIPKLFSDRNYVNQCLKHVTDPNVIDFWTKEMPSSERSNEFGEVKSWFVSKFGAFLSNEMMRNIIGQTKSAFNLREVMDKNKILLVNLSKGRTGELNSKLLGMIFVMKFQAAAMSRADVAEDMRPDFCLYVDEFQNFSTDSFATILSEARKYRLNLIVANQFTTQLTDEIRDAVFGNVGSIVSFRVGADADADALSKKFQPVFDREDVLRLPNYNTITQMLISGVPTQPFSMATVPPIGTPNLKLAAALKQLSFAKYGKPRAVVEEDIFGRMAIKEQPKPAGGPFGPPAGNLSSASPFGPPTTSASPRPTAKPAATFLDEWMAKRSVSTPATSPPASRPIAAPTSVPASPAPSVAPPQVSARPPTSATTQNISGQLVEDSEVDGIAQKLKQSMADANPSTSNTPLTPVTVPSATDILNQDDTITIDNDGNLQNNIELNKPD